MLVSLLRHCLFLTTVSCGWLLIFAARAPAEGQGTAAGRAHHTVFAGSELEDYLRYLQLRGASPIHPWTIRSLSPREVDRLSPANDVSHPWALQYQLGPESRRVVDLVPPSLRTTFNSAYAFGSNDGPVWAGRGFTVSLGFGFGAQLGPLTLTVAPQIFRAENAAFDLLPNGQEGRLQYADGGLYGFQIDLPQRFGDQAYSRFDPGQSTVRLDVYGFAAGVSTANQYWGPASAHPIILGNNAPGFLHAFVGTSVPADIWVGHLHGRLIWGRLEQSEFSWMADSVANRFMSGVVGSFSPRGVPGLELGAARFYHEHWPEDGVTSAYFGRPFEPLYKGILRRRNPDPERPGEVSGPPSNQLASIFMRWVLPGSGFEVYAEYGKEDHNYDFRDLVLNSDHNAGYMVGFRKSWSGPSMSFWGVRGELLNLQVTHLRQARDQQAFYQHSILRQGHTHRGQILGSVAGYGGAGSLLAVDRYHPAGRWTIAWERRLRQDRGFYWRDGMADPAGTDVLHSLGVEGLLFRGRWEIDAGVAGVQNFNRNHQSDAFNLNARLGVRARMW